jgi:RAD54-like protein 2
MQVNISHKNFVELSVLAMVIERRPETLSEPPFTHESLLVDRKEKKLSRAEKRMALENFEMERTAKISYTR